MKSASELFACLQNAFGQKLSYVEFKNQLQARVQQQHEGVWEFADALWEIGGKMQQVRRRREEDRLWLLYTWFFRNLRDRKTGVKLQKWWEGQPRMQWEELVQRAADRVRETDQILREEAELRRSKLRIGSRPESAHSSPPCSVCEHQGHLGYQCEQFKHVLSKASGNGNP